jgi:hypothetical protein
MKIQVLIASLLLVILGCTTTTSAPPPAAESEFKNLQVLPKNIEREQLLTVMKSFTAGLGVRCNFCHVVTATDPKEVLDFPSDAKEEKRVARVMMQMVNDINGKHMPRVAQVEGEAEAPRVVCWTCHRGNPEPAEPAPAG